MDNKTRFMQLYEQIKNPQNGYFPLKAFLIIQLKRSYAKRLITAI